MLAGLVLLVAGALGALFAAAGEGGALRPLGPYLRGVVLFSLAQAAASTLLSLALGTALALALARRRFPGRSLLLAALGAAAAMPAVVVVFAVLAVYGRQGWVAQAAGALGVPIEPRIFGWPGILLAHVILNGALVARIALDALASVPAEHARLAAALRFGPLDVFRHLDGPALRRTLPGTAGLVFLLCFTSFAIVLALGGGPARSTLEVAIFEALRTEFDLARAAWLALAQVALCLAVSALFLRAVPPPPAAATGRMAAPRADAAHRGLRVLDGAVLALGLLLVLPPLASLLMGLPALPRVLDRDLLRALLTSLTVALTAGALAAGLAVALAAGARHARLRARRPGLAALHDLAPTLLVAVPPFALAAGLFLVLRPLAAPEGIGLLLLPLLNALAALPFATRLVAPALLVAGERYGRLADQLALGPLTRLRVADGPLLWRPLLAGFSLAAAFSLGDFGVVALFGGEALRTLPLLLFERLGAYRVEEAGSVALLLVALTFAFALPTALRQSEAG